MRFYLQLQARPAEYKADNPQYIRIVGSFVPAELVPGFPIAQRVPPVRRPQYQAGFTAGAGMLVRLQAEAQSGTVLAAGGRYIAGAEIYLAANIEDSQAALPRDGIPGIIVPQLYGQVTRCFGIADSPPGPRASRARPKLCSRRSDWAD